MLWSDSRLVGRSNNKPTDCKTWRKEKNVPNGNFQQKEKTDDVFGGIAPEDAFLNAGS